VAKEQSNVSISSSGTVRTGGGVTKWGRSMNEIGGGSCAPDVRGDVFGGPAGGTAGKSMLH